ncbi:cytosol aminopeptidase family, catalytic domain-containing protein [Globomyces pollinis-pini]|nr:cytosol aminopeptidase family, catalytic domain-containing protein [Globomyces pollinis-pini]
MGVIRNDLIEDAVATHIPLKGDAQIILLVPNKEQAYAAGLAACRPFPLYNQKTGKKAPDTRNVHVTFHVENGEQVNLEEIQVLSDGIRQAQKLMDTPCAELRTTDFVNHAKTLVANLVKEYGSDTVSIKVISGKDLDEQHFGGIYGVGKAASEPPALVIMSYTPKAAEKTLALVGKGIVYDTGGLSIKGTAGMCGMKHDMGGAAGVFSAFEAIVRNKVQKNVHALLCLAENAVGPDSFRNDDILYMYSKKTVEVNNTDAEGRLVLADGVAYASQHLSPSIIINMATLTGAQMICTGLKHAGILTASEKVEQMAKEAAKSTGDLVHPFVYAPELLEYIFDSPVADMKNSVSDRANAQASCAGHFIERHISEQYSNEWLHIDIAGPGSKKARGTGFGVALLYQIAKNY